VKTLGFKDKLRNASKIKTSSIKRDNKRMGTIAYYTELLFSLLGKGNVDAPDEGTIIPEGYFYYSTNKIFTKDTVKKVLFLHELPMEIEYEFLTNLKRIASENGELKIVKRFTPYRFDRNSWATRNRMQIWKGHAERYEREKYKQSETDEIFSDLATKEVNRRILWMIRSWDWVNRTERNRDEFCRYNIILELTAKDLPNLYKMEENISSALRSLDVDFGGIFVQTNEYYKTYSPASNGTPTLLSKMNKPNIISDRVASQFFDPGHGLAGDPDGLYFGTDVFTLESVTYNLKKGSDAANFLLTADTGGGKSAVSKTLMTHLALEGIYSIDVDYEGDEYTDIGIAHGAKFINMSSEASTYFDTTEIGDLTGDPKIDRTLKEEAISTTKLVFDVLTDFKNGMNFEELSLFNDMILRVYEKRGVTEDPETWKYSKGSSYEELYRELWIMRDEPEYASKREQIDAFITKLRLYFDGNIYSGMFKNKISVNDLLGHPRIIFSFGMRGKTENTIDERSLALRQLFVGYLIMLICNYNKTVLKKLTAVKLEELQRYMTHEASGKIVNDIITGGRKRNMIVFLITNSPLQLVDIMTADDNSEMSKYSKAIKNNIQGFIIGRLTDETSERLAQSFTQLKNCLPEMKLINKDMDFKYCFLLHYRGESSVVKFEIPPSLVKTSLYVTRTEQEE